LSKYSDYDGAVLIDLMKTYLYRKNRPTTAKREVAEKGEWKKDKYEFVRIEEH
jgi:hypothetical protein